MTCRPYFSPAPTRLSSETARVHQWPELKPGRAPMEPIEVTVAEDGNVTVMIDLKNGERGELELPFDLAKDLLIKLRSRLESFENRRGWR